MHILYLQSTFNIQKKILIHYSKSAKARKSRLLEYVKALEEGATEWFLYAREREKETADRSGEKRELRRCVMCARAELEPENFSVCRVVCADRHIALVQSQENIGAESRAGYRQQ